jgi:hypothetical protein
MARKSKLVFKMKSQVLNFSFNDATFWIQILIWFQQNFDLQVWIPQNLT